MAALNPTDQVFDFEELEYHYLVANRTEDARDESSEESIDENNEKNMSIDEPPLDQLSTSPQLKSPKKSSKNKKSDVSISLNF